MRCLLKRSRDIEGAILRVLLCLYKAFHIKALPRGYQVETYGNVCVFFLEEKQRRWFYSRIIRKLYLKFNLFLNAIGNDVSMG